MGTRRRARRTFLKVSRCQPTKAFSRRRNRNMTTLAGQIAKPRQTLGARVMRKCLTTTNRRMQRVERKRKKKRTRTSLRTAGGSSCCQTRETFDRYLLGPGRTKKDQLRYDT